MISENIIELKKEIKEFQDEMRSKLLNIHETEKVIQINRLHDRDYKIINVDFNEEGIKVTLSCGNDRVDIYNTNEINFLDEETNELYQFINKINTKYVILKNSNIFREFYFSEILNITDDMKIYKVGEIVKGVSVDLFGNETTCETKAKCYESLTSENKDENIKIFNKFNDDNKVEIKFDFNTDYLDEKELIEFIDINFNDFIKNNKLNKNTIKFEMSNEDRTILIATITDYSVFHFIRLCDDCCYLFHEDSDEWTEGGCGCCSKCYNDNYSYCEECGDDYANDDGVYSEENDQDYCCRDCRNSAEGGNGDSTFWNSNKAELDTTTNILSDRKYGVEFETKSFNGKPSDETKNNFSGVFDGSINGTELVSDILHGDSGVDAIQNMLKDIKNNNDAEIDKSCGFHIHISVEDFTANNLIRAYRVLKMNEDIFLSTQTKVRRNNNYCKPIKNYPKEVHGYAIDNSSVDGVAASLIASDPRVLKQGWTRYESKEQKIASIKNNTKMGKYCYDSRYVWANFVPVLRQGTIEIRHHSATLNGHKAKMWTYLWVGFMDAVKSEKMLIKKYSNISNIIDKLNYSDDVKKVMKKYFVRRIAKFDEVNQEKRNEKLKAVTE